MSQQCHGIRDSAGLNESAHLCSDCAVDNYRKHRELATPVAVVGMAMRLPGGVRSEEAFWDMMIEKRDGLCKVPMTRYNVDSFYNNSKPHSVKAERACFLQDDPACFAAGFFHIPDYEAERLDPQQRLLLEIVWECMENGGQTDWRGKNTGCFVGVFGEDWLDYSCKDVQQIDRYHVLGTGDFALSNRISYVYDLTGPSMTLKTGCSSSMVGLHEACKALEIGDCSGAIVAGSNMILTPTMTTTMSDNSVISPDGICKTFDASADGYGRGEALNAIYIKRLEDALRDGDPIRAVIRATSTNCDGKTQGITTPGSLTQERLIRDTYRRAGISNLCDTAFVECHGTGTSVGDLAETSVLAKAFGDKGVYIGAFLSRKQDSVPIDVTPWPADREERVSVNCFGVGGANAHAVLDSYNSFCRNDRRSSKAPRKGAQLLLLSAASKKTLRRRASEIKEYIDRKSPNLQDVAYTLALKRDHLAYRTFLIAETDQLTVPENLHMTQAKESVPVFVFTGQGAQWAGMGKGLFENFCAFANGIRKMDRALQKLHNRPEWSIEHELLAPEHKSSINDAEISQPLCTAVQIGIVDLLCTWGVRPGFVIGHSSGEIAAAYAADALSLESAIIIAFQRGQATKSARQGAMASIGMAATDVQPYLDDGVLVACENSPCNVTVSGDTEKVDSLLSRLSEDRAHIFTRRLQVRVAYHSHHMKDIGSGYEQSIEPYINPTQAILPFYSTVTAETIQNPSDLNAAYWRRNLESPVVFSTALSHALKAIKKEKRCLFVEIGPHPALLSHIRQVVQASSLALNTEYIPTLVRSGNPTHDILTMAGCLHASGLEVNLEKLIGVGRITTDIPLYPWDHDSRYWNGSLISDSWRLRVFPHHELLGSRWPGSNDLEPIWRNVLRLDDVPWLGDHKIGRDIVFPGAGYVAMVGEAIRQITGDEAFTIRNIVLKLPLVLNDTQQAELLTSLKPCRLTDGEDSSWFDWSIAAYDGSVWTIHTKGQAKGGFQGMSDSRTITHFPRKLEAASWYSFLSNCGLKYGPRFRALNDITAHPIQYSAAGKLDGNCNLHESYYSLHPTVIDQSLQVLGVAACRGQTRAIDKVFLPAFVGSISVAKATGPMMLTSEVDKASGATLTGNALVTCNDRPVLCFQEGVLFALDEQSAISDSEMPLISYIDWKPDLSLSPTQDLLPFRQAGRDKNVVIKRTFSAIVESACQVKSVHPASPHLKRYREWLLKESEKACCNPLCAQSPDNRYCVVPETDLSDTGKVETSGNLNTAKTAKRCWEKAVITVKDNIIGILEGQISPLELLMENNLLADLYSDANPYETWKPFISSLAHRNPRMRVLEIGAGTGGSTAVALDLLTSSTGVAMYNNYTFTDISLGFLLHAEERFSTYKRVSYSILDIAMDPRSQGFELGSFDLIIAANVLHAIPTIQVGLQNIKSLLAPGGRLLLQELCPDLPSNDYIMGTLPGWWVGEDEGRLEKPHISVEDWDNALRTAGFTGVEASTFDDVKPCRINVNILSRRSEGSVAVTSRISLIYHNKVHPWSQHLEEHLAHLGYEVQHFCVKDSSCPTTGDIIFLVDLEGPYLSGMSNEEFSALQSYLLKLSSSRIMWITPTIQTTCHDPRYGLILGLARTIRKETLLDFGTLEVDSFDSSSLPATIGAFEAFRRQTFGSQESDFEYSVASGVVHLPRAHWAFPEEIAASTATSGLPKQIGVRSYGCLDSIEWLTSETQPELGLSEIEVDIQYTGLNFRDIMVLMGLFGSINEIGLEASGVVRRVGVKVENLSPGDKVIVGGTGLLISKKVIGSQACIKIPDGLSLEDAASIPAVFATAVYSLLHVGGLKKGQSVLIHSATGGVGLAAIQVCQFMEAEIFATVGSEAKAQHLMASHSIPRNRIFSSRSASFLHELMRETQGKGADIVLNSLAGELLQASWQCVAPYGKMIELGKRDILGHGLLSMDKFLSNRAFFGVDISSLRDDHPDKFQGLVQQILEWYEQGKIHPIRPVQVFEAAKVQDAFRYMQKGIHMGKNVVHFPENIADLAARPQCPQLHLMPNAAFLLVGGLGGLGKAVSNWLIEKGVRHLVYLSRSCNLVKYSSFVEELEAQGCSVTMVQGDVTHLPDVQRAIAASPRPIRGAMLLSMVLKDQSFGKMTLEDWNHATAPKVRGAWNLHRALEQAPLDSFVLFSSVSGLCGNAGQANYAAANTFLNSFVLFRRSLGLPASAIDVGVVEDIGAVSQDQRLIGWMRLSSVHLLREKDVLDSLGLAIYSPNQYSHTPWNSGSFAIGVDCTRSLDCSDTIPLWDRRDLRFNTYQNYETLSHDTNVGHDASEDLREFLGRIQYDLALLDNPDTKDKVVKDLGSMVASRTGQREDMSPEELAAIAIDSLMAIELRNWLRRKLNVEVSLGDISKTGTVGGLANLILDDQRRKHFLESS